MATPIPNEDFALVEYGDDNDPWYCVRILCDKYEGILYRYNWVKLPDPDNFRLKFDYEVIENPYEKDFKVKDFEQFIGDVLVYIINQELIRREHEKNRDGNTESPTEE